MAVAVTIDNFREAETARMFDSFVEPAGGVNRWLHYRKPTPIEAQPVIRMNRDTLYGAAIVDISKGATLTIPDHGDRYVSVMAVNESHYINAIYSAPGRYELRQEEHGSPFVALFARVFIDPSDESEIAAVNTVQDGLVVEAASSKPYLHPDYDPQTLDATRETLARLGQGLGSSARTFGSPSEVEPTRHLIGTAIGWGGLPQYEAFYAIESEPRPLGEFTMTLRDVPVDAFWSVTVYNKDGYFEPNPFDSYSLNSVTATPEADGSYVLRFAPEPGGATNHLYVMDGWNYTMRFYRPRPEIVDGRWQAPRPEPVAN
jgi:hypothetical protein